MALNRALGVGSVLYAVAAVSDAVMTVRGIAGDPSLEGNVVLRALMVRIGVLPALVVEKSAVALVCGAIGVFLAPEIRRGAAWIDRVPTMPWARAWMKREDRSWIAYLPLYGAAVFQALAALAWALI